MTCDVNDGVSLFAVLKTLAFAYLLNQRKNRIEQVLLCWKWLQGFRNTMWPAVVHFFQYFQSSAVCVAIWLPSSASTPQVGFVSIKPSPTREGKLRSQGRRRTAQEVPCSGVLLWVLLARFEMAVGSGR